MAVDANVIIFSRIREEIAAGTNVSAAIDSGFSKALSAIIDGNVTTSGSLDVIGKINGNVTAFGKLNVTGALEGNLTAAEIYAENARITGEVRSQGAAKIGQSSVIIGNIYASSAVVAGAVKGDIDVDTVSSVALNLKNGSDYTGAIADRYAAEYPDLVRVIHQENGGVSRARNCGMDHVRGEYFVCVDSDDVVEPCYMEDLVSTAEAHPELGHVICGFKCTSHVHDYIFTDQEPLTVVGRRDYMRLYDLILIQSPWLSLYKTEVVRKHSIKMREDLSLAEDISFNLAYLDVLGDAQIGIINKTNYIYMDKEQDTLYRKYRPDLLEINETIYRILAYYLEKWDINDDASLQSYYGSVFYGYQSVLKNTFNIQNPMPFREKLAYNNKILKNESFLEALIKKPNIIIPSLRRAYQSGDYMKVLAVEHIQMIKQRIRKIIKL